MAKILISGGTGLIGTHLIPKLMEQGHEVAILSRKSGTKLINGYTIQLYQWNLKEGSIDDQAFKHLDYVIHLAGKNINIPWTKKNKKEILFSRTESAKLIIDKLKEHQISLKKFISASGVGIYGETYGKALNEHQANSKDFAAKVCVKWEKSLQSLDDLNIPKVIFRLGVVLSNNGGAFSIMKKPFIFGLGSPLGSGEQFLPWVHIEDVCHAFLHAINEDLIGTYNLASPNACSNAYFSKTLAKVMRRPYFMPNVPSFILQVILGERAWIALTGTRVSVDKLLNERFAFQFPNLEDALKNLLK